MVKNEVLLPFNRSSFLNPEKRITYIGDGCLGGKAQGLVNAHRIVNSNLESEKYKNIYFDIPSMTVIKTDVFDAFMKQNNLYSIALSDADDERIAHAFQKANLPFGVLGDLRALISQVNIPLAVRSSSMLEDSQHEPFAGIYGTKMTPNNQPDVNTRFNKLMEAIKYVYASTFFKAAKDYMKATAHKTEDEKMAVIIQEVIGTRHDERYYPELSGVARSYNYYAFGNAEPEEGIVSLASGLGKTIVDGGCSWSFSPQYPRSEPPFGSISEMMKNTQNDFFAVNMGKAPAYDPVNETEYLVHSNISVADADKSLKYVASTLDSKSGRMITGTGKQGPRILTFAPILRLDEVPLVDLVSDILRLCEDDAGDPVEIEFAMTFHEDKPHRFGFLQVRPMVVSKEQVTVEKEELKADGLLCASPSVLGNGVSSNICDVVYLKTNKFDSATTYKIASEIDAINRGLLSNNIPYVLVGFGRWGTSDAWAGIPVTWGQISGAKIIVEAPLEGMNTELSQGSHFFHNVTGFGVKYFSIPYSNEYPVNWDLLNLQPAISETEYVRHVRIKKPLSIKVDGKSGRGIISTKSFL